MLDYQLLLQPEDSGRLIGPLQNDFSKMHLDSKLKENYDGLGSMLEDLETNYVVTEYNRRVFSLTNNYVLAKKYLERGIPDEPYYQTPGKNGEGISYFPLFEEEHYGNHYWYGVCTEALYFRLEGLIDSIYHILNLKFKLNIAPKSGFQRHVRNALERKEGALVIHLKNLNSNSVYRKAKEIRNDITHNFNPNALDSGIVIQRDENGKLTGASMGIAEYMTVSEVQNNIDDLIPLIASLTEEVQRYL